jgi:glycosyltransferase involved in cell wall biosynthesis
VVGGVEHRNAELARWLALGGHRVTLAGFGAVVPPPGVELLSLGPAEPLYDAAGRRRPHGALRLAAAAARLDLGAFDVVEAANIPYAHLPILALRCRAAGVPLLVTWHEYWGGYWREYLGSPSWRLFAFAERLTAPLGSQAIADSRLTADRLTKLRRRPVPVVPIGIPVARIRAAAAAGAARSGPPLVAAGRLLPAKRLDLLLAALAELPGDDLLLSVIGDGPDRERLVGVAERLGVAHRVVWRGRLPSAEAVWEELGAARIAVHPSRREGFGMFPLEALAAGLPVVCCRSEESAVEELVQHDRTGLVAEPEAASLAAALRRLLADEPLRQRLAAAGTRLADDHDWPAQAERFAAVAAELAGRSRAGRAAAQRRA